VYSVSEVGGHKRLVRRGPLKDYLPAVATLPVETGATTDIDHHQTTNKRMRAATKFLSRALAYLGVTQIPKLELSFVGGEEIVISFSDVTYTRVNITAIEPLLQRLHPTAVPDEVARDRLHVAYEYLYASRINIARADRNAFDVDVSGKLHELIDVGSSAKVSVERGTQLSFTGVGTRAAFAYRAAQLQKRDRWTIDMEVSIRADGRPTGVPYLPAAQGVVLESDEAPPGSDRGTP
jgi:hypothetical protein